MVEVKVKGIASEKSSTRHVLLLEDNVHRTLSISIGLPEAQAVILTLKKVRFSPPLIYDFVSSLLPELAVKPLRVEIIAHRNNSYYAQFVIQLGDRLKYLECRPSDGVALALRCEVPVLVQEGLMEARPPVTVPRRRKQRPSRISPLTGAEVDEIKEEIEGLSAEEFWRRVKT